MNTVRAILANSANAISAQAIARAAGVPLEYVYLDLVSLEAQGVAHVVVSHRHGERSERLWTCGEGQRGQM
jgi:hypothetical protein